MSAAIPDEAYIEARVTLVPTDAGGRRRPIASGYRCGFLIGNPFADREQQNDAAIYLVDSVELTPGAEAIARIRPAVPASWTAVKAGATLRMCEGPRTIGSATVTAVRRSQAVS